MIFLARAKLTVNAMKKQIEFLRKSKKVNWFKDVIIKKNNIFEYIKKS